MKKGITLIIVAFVLSTTAYAQNFLFGVQIGANLSNMHETIDRTSERKYNRLGFEMGFTLDFGINDHLYVLTGLEYTIKGARSSSSSTNFRTYAPMYLKVPVHLGYKVHLGQNTRLVFRAGPYFAYGIGGRERDVTRSGSNRIVVSDSFFNEHNNFDLGAGIGLGVEIGIIAVTIGYDWGFLDIAKSENHSRHNRNAFLNIGLKF